MLEEEELERGLAVADDGFAVRTHAYPGDRASGLAGFLEAFCFFGNVENVNTTVLVDLFVEKALNGVRGGRDLCLRARGQSEGAEGDGKD